MTAARRITYINLQGDSQGPKQMGSFQKRLLTGAMIELGGQKRRGKMAELLR